ncbi:MAG: hypothetical protein ACREC6_04425 [Hyphomicrobiaceae bacterium]
MLIPNRIADCLFKAACDKHDACYSRCEKGCGDLYGRPECEGTCETKRERKKLCDKDFRMQLVRDNLGKPHCRTAATAYYLAVTHGGCTYFRSVRETLPVRQKMQNDFDALLKFLEDNPDTAKQIEAEIAIEQLATIEAGKNNDLAVNDGRLSLVASSPARRTRAAKTERLLVNGIDLTDASLDASMHDVMRVLEGLKVERGPQR